MNYKKILDKLNCPTLDIIPFKLSENGDWVLHQFIANDSKGDFLLDMWITFNDTLFRTNSITQLHKIKAGLRMYVHGALKLGYSTDYFEPTERKVSEKIYKSLLCKFLPNKEGEDTYINELDVHAMLENWNFALQGRKTIYLMESMNILSVYDKPDRIQYADDDFIENFGESFEVIMHSNSPDYVKDVFNKRIFSTEAGQSFLAKYQNLSENGTK